MVFWLGSELFSLSAFIALRWHAHAQPSNVDFSWHTLDSWESLGSHADIDWVLSQLAFQTPDSTDDEGKTK